MKHILIISSHGPSFIKFRLHLIKKLLSRGYKVSVASPKKNFSHNLQKQLIQLGVKLNFFNILRTELNIFNNLKTLFEIYKIIKRINPNVVISYTAKPVIYTGIILKIFKQIRFFPLITGLGFTFTEINSIKKFFLRFLMIQLYRIGLKNSDKIIFQNKEDRSLFYRLKIIKDKNLSKVVNGSGIDLNDYPRASLPSKQVFLMVARLLVDKGVREYVEAAKIVRSFYPGAVFQLAGYLDKNPSAISAKELKLWIKDGSIEYLGEIDPVNSILKSCKFYVLPSYREGTPRSVLEALATGRPIITTNTAGCRETVIHKKNGLLVPIKDPVALSKAMMKLLKEKDENLKKMASKSYMIARNKFEINKVNKSMLHIMNL